MANRDQAMYCPPKTAPRLNLDVEPVAAFSDSSTEW